MFANLRIMSSSLQNSFIAPVTVLLKVVTEGMHLAKIGRVTLILLLDESQCKRHTPVPLCGEFLDERGDLCMPSTLSLQTALVPLPLCTPMLLELVG